MAIQVSNTDMPTLGSRREQREAYLKTLLATLQGNMTDPLTFPAVRSKAEALLKEHTFPSTKQEAWRFTDLTPMLSVPFEASAASLEVETSILSAVQMPEAGARLVLVNGQFSAALSDVEALPAGVVVGSLTDLDTGAMQASLAARFAQAAGGHEIFTALNTVGFQDAAVVWVPPNQVIEAPIQVVYLSIDQATPTITCPRCLVVAESGSALTLVEDFWGPGTQDQFNNSVTEIWADENAQVTHVRLQREGAGTFHIGKTTVTQGGGSRYLSTAVTLGARLSRHNLEVYQTGAQTDTKLYGLTAIADTQLADTHSLVAFNHPHGTAEQLHKCIMDGQSHAVFNGQIWVPQNAQMTNASQLNRNLLLSGKARVDTKPELDIVADNVKCAHGATVSQLDANEVFYLQSRGISAEAAQRLLIYGFAMDIIDRIPVPTLQEMLTATVTQWTR